MQASSKIYVLFGVLVILAVAVASNYVLVPFETYQHAKHTTNAGELITDTLVGQTFVSEEDNLSSVAVMFATYSGRENTKLVTFHLRESLDADRDIRTDTVPARELGDNQFHRFSFDPVPESKGKTYFFYVTSQQSQPGDAVTVDLNTTDPYHLGSAFLVRGHGENILDPDVLSRSGKQTVDVVFATYHSVPLRVAVVERTRDIAREFIGTWHEKRSQYLLWAQLLVPVVVLVGLLLGLRNKDGRGDLSRKTVILLLASLFIFGVLWRVFYAVNMPLTNDEGNYLYDARSLVRGVLAGGDGYVKAPLVVAWVALWQFIGGASLLAGRLGSVIVSAALVWPLYTIGRLAWHQRAGVLVAALWALVGAPAVFGVYVHTQSVALFFGVTAIAVLWRTLREGEEHSGHDVSEAKNRFSQLLLAGVLFGLGVASRKSVLALGLVPVVLILFESTTWRERLMRYLGVGIGFVLIIAVFLGGATLVYGQEGFYEALGFNSAEDGITAVDPAEADQVRAYSLRGMTPFFRESIPLILFGVLGWGFLLERACRRLIRWSVTKPPFRTARFLLDHVAPKLIWILPIFVFSWAWSFFFEYEGSVFHDFGGMTWLWYGGITLLVGGILWPRSTSEALVFAPEKDEVVVPRSTQPPARLKEKKDLEQPSILPNVAAGPAERMLKSRSVSQESSFSPKRETRLFSLAQSWAIALLPLAWMGGLVVFYMNWIKFHANYIIEFLPPLIVAAGVGVFVAWDRVRVGKDRSILHPLATFGMRVVAIFVLGVLVWSTYTSNYITYVYEHTGTFDLGSVKEAAAWANENIPHDQRIFTGAGAIPYLSGHRTALDIAHPRWYAYQFTREDTDRLETFLPSADEMVQAFRDSEWVLLERQTGFSFLMEYTEIERSLLEGDFELVYEVENGSNPLQFYKRI